MNHLGNPPEQDETTYAAVDLGSNSFHLLVARRQHRELRVLDRIRDMVQLGAGLDDQGQLDRSTRDRALECLARFGQRLRGIPESNIRAVGTQTLRRMHHSGAFLVVAETALGCPIEIIAGREEARLIYLGISQGVAGTHRRRLTIDIGGGSTEIVAGSGASAHLLESLQFGCVSVSKRYFPNGDLREACWRRAELAVREELQELRTRYIQFGWNQVIGSSGTIRAVAKICQIAAWSEKYITPEALDKLQQQLIEAEHDQNIDLQGLSERRRQVIAGGVAILRACFDALSITRMEVSPFALREGVLHDLLGRLEHRDPRAKTVKAFMLRFNVDVSQATRVRETALEAFRQIESAAALKNTHKEFLEWAADLHETGLAICHSQYQRHSAYLIAESDMAGFSREEQLFLATLVRHHRRAIGQDFASALPARLHPSLMALLFCLRLGWILCRTREDAIIPNFHLELKGSTAKASFPEPWMQGHPLTQAGLEQEFELLAAIDLKLELHPVRNDEEH